MVWMLFVLAAILLSAYLMAAKYFYQKLEKKVLQSKDKFAKREFSINLNLEQRTAIGAWEPLFCIVTFYVSNLRSFIISPLLEKPIDSLTDVVDK